MIAPNELKVGNKVYLELGLPGLNVHTIKGQDIADIENGRITLRSITGIPLTPEILIDCGFKEDDQAFYWTNGRKTIGVSFEQQLPEVVYEPDIGMRFSNLDVDIEYLHQFQNLFFVLINSELIINVD